MDDDPLDAAELYAAWVDALAELTTVTKGADSDQFGGYRYADLGDIVKATRPVLAAHGLALVSPVGEHGDRLAVTVRIYHRSGARIDFPPLPFPYGKDAQATGSLITYHRRYATLAALGMAAGEPNPIADAGDDDGAAGEYAAPRTPGFRTSVIDATKGLSDERRAELREWLEAEGLPDRPGLMDEAQCERVVAWIMEPSSGT